MTYQPDPKHIVHETRVVSDMIDHRSAEVFIEVSNLAPGVDYLSLRGSDLGVLSVAQRQRVWRAISEIVTMLGDLEVERAEERETPAPEAPSQRDDGSGPDGTGEFQAAPDPAPSPSKPAEPRKAKRPPLTADEDVALAKAIDKGIDRAAVAEAFGVSVHTIPDVLHRVRNASPNGTTVPTKAEPPPAVTAVPTAIEAICWCGAQTLPWTAEQARDGDKPTCGAAECTREEHMKPRGIRTAS